MLTNTRKAHVGCRQEGWLEILTGRALCLRSASSQRLSSVLEGSSPYSSRYDTCARGSKICLKLHESRNARQTSG